MPPALLADHTAAAEQAYALLVASEVARRADETQEPADRLLREALREARLGPSASVTAARAMFTWFRWRGFVASAAQPAEPARLRQALALAERFREEPASFDDAALLDGALPGWWRAHWPVTGPLVRALQSEPVLWLRARPGEARRLAAEFPGAQAGVWRGVPDAVRHAGETDVFRSAAFAAGRCEIQDVASQAVSIVCDPQPGETWWDACAGEGGKTLHLCDLMGNRGVVWASDRSSARLQVLRRRAARARLFNYRVVPWQGGARPPTRTRFDGILVDAPCSGIGTWHRNPHARWTTGPADVRELAAIQQQLLATAALALKPGGRLVYAVCTLTRAETEMVAAEFLRTHPDFAPAAFADPFADLSPVANAPTVTRAAWEPQLTGGNGMFVAAWRRGR